MYRRTFELTLAAAFIIHISSHFTQQLNKIWSTLSHSDTLHFDNSSIHNMHIRMINNDPIMAQISKQLPSHQSGEKEGERSAYTCASLSNPPPLLSYSQSPTPHSPSATPHSPSPTPHSPSPTPHSPSPTPHSPSPTPYSLPPPHSSLTNPVLPLNHRMSKTRSGVQALTVKSSSSCELTSVSTKHLLLSYCFIVGRSKSCLQAKWGDTPREAFQILGTSMIQTSPRLPPPITTHFRSRSVHSYIHNHYSAPSPSITQHLPHPSLSTFPIHR